MIGKKESSEKNDTWCTISVNEIKTKVKVRHMGGGKFKDVNDESEGNLIRMLDASEILVANVSIEYRLLPSLKTNAFSY